MNFGNRNVCSTHKRNSVQSLQRPDFNFENFDDPIDQYLNENLLEENPLVFMHRKKK